MIEYLIFLKLLHVRLHQKGIIFQVLITQCDFNYQLMVDPLYIVDLLFLINGCCVVAVLIVLFLSNFSFPLYYGSPASLVNISETIEGNSN